MINRRRIYPLFLIPVVMFGFGYLMVPIYDVFCELTGLNGKTGSIEVSQSEAFKTDKQRLVKVEFISVLNQQAPWEFTPQVNSMWVNPGKTYKTNYIAINQLNRQMIGQAVPSLAPSKAASFFKKTECFCFSQQKFAANETKQMPLIFVIDPRLPKDINTVTLSYTFFDVNNRIDQSQIN